MSPIEHAAEYISDPGGAGVPGGLQHTDEGLESSSSAFVLRTVGDLSGDDRRTQGSFRPVVSGLDPGIVEEPQEIPSVVLSTDAIQQSLVIVIA